MAYHPQPTSTSNPPNALNCPDILIDTLDLLEISPSRMPSASGTATPYTHDCVHAADVLAEQVRTPYMHFMGFLGGPQRLGSHYALPPIPLRIRSSRVRC